MGHLDVLPIISDGFNIYFPILILILCLATYFRVGTRILNFMGFQQFVESDELAVDLVNEGRELMQRERRKRLRAEETKNRREQLMELVNNTSNFGRVSRFSRREHARKFSGVKDSFWSSKTKMDEFFSTNVPPLTTIFQTLALFQISVNNIKKFLLKFIFSKRIRIFFKKELIFWNNFVFLISFLIEKIIRKIFY